MPEAPQQSDEKAWLPDGRGLPDEARDIIKNIQCGSVPVHLRLTAPDGSSARGACENVRAWGQWWSGVSADVTCKACLEVVHA